MVELRLVPATLRVIGLLAIFFLLPTDGFSQEQGGDVSAHSAAATTEPERRLLAPPRIERVEVEIDGRPDEPIWAKAWTVPDLHQLAPNEGAPPSESTKIQIFYDSEAIYVSARVHETDPSAIVDRDFERNGYHRSRQDGIGIILDTNGDGRTAFGFIVTPSGARTDVAVVDDRRVNWNADWNAFWDAEAVRNATGWSMEMRIPFSSLRFQPNANGEVQMGLIAWRYLARNDEINVFPAIPDNWGNSAYKPDQAAPIDFHGIEPHSPLYIKPYLLGGLTRESRLNDAGDGYVGEGSRVHDLGLDLKYNLTSNLVLDVTVNTDFAQVEADDVNFSLDRFSLFFPEKRDFFQERSDLFQFGFPGSRDRLFHSRNIGIREGHPIPILGGARLTGSHGDWNVGLLSMQTASTTFGERELPSENFGVVRLQRPVLEHGSYVGGMVTSRAELGSSHNLVYALDADLHLAGDLFTDVMVAQSIDSEEGAGGNAMGSVGIQRRIDRGLFFGSSVRYVGPDFRPATGFLQRSGYVRWGARGGYAWFPGSESRVRRLSLAYRPEAFWGRPAGYLETSSHSFSWDVGFRDGSAAEVEVSQTRESLDQGFRVGDVVIPAGRYRFTEGALGYSSPTGRAVHASGELSGGGYFGGDRIGLSLEVGWSPGTYLSVGTQNVLNRIRVPDGKYDVVLSRLRVGTAVSRNLTASAYVQHNSSDHTLAPNVRIRYNPREGSDLYLVYNEQVNTSLLPGQAFLPRLPRSQGRSFQVKYTYTFVH